MRERGRKGAKRVTRVILLSFSLVQPLTDITWDTHFVNHLTFTALLVLLFRFSDFFVSSLKCNV